MTQTSRTLSVAQTASGHHSTTDEARLQGTLAPGAFDRTWLSFSPWSIVKYVQKAQR